MNTNLNIPLMEKVPLSELTLRMKRFLAEMDKDHPNWEMAVIFSKVNLYYFTGTMQDGMLLIQRDNEPVLWVRRSFERACDESLFPSIRPMNSFRDAAENVKNFPATVHIETEVVPVAMLQRFKKYFPIKEIKSLDRQISRVRALKSKYELEIMEKSGKLHARLLEELVPGLLREGISEAEFAGELYSVMIKEGHHGVARFAMFDTDIGLGQIGFGESSIYPSFFDGPGGSYGMSPAVPVIGSRERRLRKGDLVFVDLGFGVNGYHTDKTMTYVFGGSLPEEAVKIHKKCVEIQERIAERLKPGVIPEDLYNSIMDSLDNNFLENFMGFGKRQVRFLGHGIGLHIDEWPVIARGFTEPLQEGIAIAVEPKKGIENIGMVGIENTFIVTCEGGRCITGSNPGLITV